MVKPTNSKSESLLDRFNRRREKVAAEAHGDQIDQEHVVSEGHVENDIADEEDALSDNELLKKYDLPDPETIEDETGLDRFFEGDMPERLKRLALRRVWRLNPLFRFADEMVEYGEDYTDAATVIDGMQTAYQVGKGYLAKVKEALDGEGGDNDFIASETSSSLDNSDMGLRKTYDTPNKNDKTDNIENFGKKEEEASRAPKSGLSTTIGGDEGEKIVETENDSDRDNQEALELSARKLSQYDQEEKIGEDLNSKNATDGRQKEDQIRTVLEGSEYQHVRPKKMVFKIPNS